MASEQAILAEEPSEPQRSETPARPPRRRRLAPWSAAGVVTLAAALVAWLYLGAAGLVRAEILKVIAERYHRTARLDRVRLDPLRLRADVEGFSLPDRDGRSMIAFRRLHAGLSWPSLLLGRVAFEELAVDGPQVRIVRRRDGRLNLADLAPPPDKSKGQPLALRIARLRLTNGEAEVIDAMRPTPFEKRFERISFSLTNFATTASGASYALSAKSEAGERLSWRGALGMAPLASSGRFEFVGWRAERLAAIMPGLLPFTVTSGVLDAKGAYAVALRGDALSLRVDLDQAALKSAAIRPRGATTDPVRAEAVTLTGAHLDLARRSVAIAHVVVTRPDVSAWRDATGAVNLAAFAPPPASPAPGGQAAGPAWTVSAPDIRIAQGRASFADRAMREPVAWTADPVDIAVAGFAYPFVQPVRITLHAAADDGSTVTAAGSLALPSAPGTSPSGTFDVALDGFELNRFQPYVAQTARVSIAAGDASAHGRLELASAGGVRFSGALAVDGLQAVDPTLKSDLVTWDRVEASGVVAASQPFSVKVGRILAQGAYGRVVLEPNYQFNIRAVLEQPGAPPPGVAALDVAPASPANPAVAGQGGRVDLPIDIDRIDFVGGRMDFTDLTVQPHFSAGVQNLSGSITGLSARAGTRAKVDLKGGVDAFAPVTISGTLDPFAADHFLDLAMQFHNMELTTFSPYSGKFAGYRIDKGKLDVDLQYHIENEHLDARHHVVINQLQLGDKVDSAEATHLPMKLIVALLKDRNGVIDLPIDISGSLADPKFRIWPVIRTVVGGMFEKVATSPFALLGDLVGHHGGEDIGNIRFQPGSSDLAMEEAAKLADLAKALDKRPALAVELPATVAPDLDGPVLAEAAYQDALRRAWREVFRRAADPDLPQALATPKLKAKLLEVAYRQTFGRPPKDGAPDAVAAALRAHFAVSDRELQALAEARTETVEAALVQNGHVDPRRVFAVAAPPLTAGPIVMAAALR